MPRTDTGPTIPTDQESQLAREMSRVLDEHAGDMSLRLQIAEAGREVTTLELPAAAARLLREMLQAMGEGRAVTVLPVEAEITTQQAADILNVSRPYVVGLIDKGVLPARLVGNQRRLRLKDVLAHDAESRARASSALSEMATIDQELGLR